MTSCERTYLDWAATTPLCSEAADVMEPFFKPWPHESTTSWNANSLHSEGRASFSTLEQARTSVATSLACRPDEVVFTSGATESDFLAIYGMAHALQRKRRMDSGDKRCGQVVLSAIEHDAVLGVGKKLQSEGFDVILVKPDSSGFVSPEALKGVLSEHTLLVSIMHVNNEIGAIQPIHALVEVTHSVGAFFHTDAAQAVGKVDFSCAEMPIDAASFSSHKVCGPKGVGALYLKAGTPFDPPIPGGGQERGFRGGTQNVAGIAGFAAALRRACDKEAGAIERAFLQSMRDALYQRLCSIEGVSPSVPCEPGSQVYAPHIVNVCVDDIETETLVLQLDMAGYAVSGGSACSSHSLEPSHVLTALGIPRDKAYGSLRVSIGRYTTQEDIDGFIEAFSSMVSSR